MYDLEKYPKGKKIKKKRDKPDMIIPPVRDLSIEDDSLDKKKLRKKILVSKTIILEAYKAGIPLKEYLKNLEKQNKNEEVKIIKMDDKNSERISSLDDNFLDPKLRTNRMDGVSAIYSKTKT